MEYTEETRLADEARRAEHEKNRPLNYPDTKQLPDPVFEPFDIVFTGSGPHLEFVEAEATFGHHGVKVGTWWTDERGCQRLTIRPGDDTGDLLWRLAERHVPFSLHFDPQTDPYTGDWTFEIADNHFAGGSPSSLLTWMVEEGAAAEPGPKPPKQFSVVVTEQGPNEPWLFNLDRFNSEDDIAIPEEVGRAILAQMTRDEEE